MPGCRHKALRGAKGGGGQQSGMGYHQHFALIAAGLIAPEEAVILQKKALHQVTGSTGDRPPAFAHKDIWLPGVPRLGSEGSREQTEA